MFLKEHYNRLHNSSGKANGDANASITSVEVLGQADLGDSQIAIER